MELQFPEVLQLCQLREQVALILRAAQVNLRDAAKHLYLIAIRQFPPPIKSLRMDRHAGR